MAQNPLAWLASRYGSAKGGPTPYRYFQEIARGARGAARGLRGLTGSSGVERYTREYAVSPIQFTGPYNAPTIEFQGRQVPTRTSTRTQAAQGRTYATMTPISNISVKKTKSFGKARRRETETGKTLRFQTFNRDTGEMDQRDIQVQNNQEGWIGNEYGTWLAARGMRDLQQWFSENESTAQDREIEKRQAMLNLYQNYLRKRGYLPEEPARKMIQN